MQNKRIIGRESAVEALASLCQNYRATALRAIREGGENVYIPADPTDSKSMLEALANPRGMVQFESVGNVREPCYANLNEFLAGKNADGTLHKGYLLVDVVAKLVTDLKDRTDRSVVPDVLPLTPQTLINDLTGRANSYCL